MTAALASARAAYAALRALDTEIAGIRALTPRKGRAQARASRIADLERIRGRREAELRTACAAMWAEACEDARRAGMIALRKYRKRTAQVCQKEFAA